MIRGFHNLLPSVPSSPRPAASKAGECNACDCTGLISSQALPNSVSATCTCETLEGHDIFGSESVFKVHENQLNVLDDWEFAGDEEKEVKERVEATDGTSHFLTSDAVRVPAEESALVYEEVNPVISSLEVRTNVAGYLDEELGQSRNCDWLEPPSPSGCVATQEGNRQIGDEGVMLEAFQQFQQSPQIQKMVVELATDARVWQAVLANKKLQQYRVGDAEGDFEAGIILKGHGIDYAAPRSKVISNFVLLSHNAARDLKEGLWDHVRGAIEVLDKRTQTETHKLMKEFMHRMLMMMALFMLSLIIFLSLLPLQVS
ncbi:uncharacterized protein [Physcomitrium patens]|uniref:Uncharacterized protein n=1 Tax=Physcomitrium patens TaxID=3218 RepID=A0A2K1IUK2_PHYPA|nr:uncharacterized protein LOC112273115 [Physcomitrium patens]PNR32952.1 hypothetical protein PHYPA_024895 [Physcomitrium patens]|eukprot:XP_024357284.1 uncharacterized protein LOC112273115 [Physcomitrella patens]